MDNIMDTLERQSKLIESQRTLFINTVEQFKRDLIFLQGSVSNLKAVNQDDKLNLGFVQLLNHVGEMNSMLNDFDARLSSHERN